MPPTSKDSGGNWQEEVSFYCPLWEWAVVRMALDHFFKDVVEGNVPLTDEAEDWWGERVVAERVTRFHKNWALLFEGLAAFRDRMDNNVPHSQVSISEALEFTYKDRRRGDALIEWAPDGEGRF